MKGPENFIIYVNVPIGFRSFFLFQSTSFEDVANANKNLKYNQDCLASIQQQYGGCVCEGRFYREIEEQEMSVGRNSFQYSTDFRRKNSGFTIEACNGYSLVAYKVKVV